MSSIYNFKNKSNKFFILIIFTIMVLSITTANSTEVISKNANVLTLGDSITAGMDENGKWVGNYYSELDIKLSKIGFSWNYLGDKSRDNHIYYQADGGFCLAPKNVFCPTSPKTPNSITELYNLFKLKHKEKLDLVFIQGGVNDISAIRHGATRMPLPIVSLKALINKVKKENPGVKIILLDITRVEFTPMESQYNKEIYKLNNPKNRIFTIKTSNLRESKYFIDGLHPNNSGYSKLAEIIFKELKNSKLI